MRRTDREITDMNIVKELLDNAHILRLALFDASYPYIVTLHYSYKLLDDNRLIFYTHGAASGYKWELLMNNPHVCIEVDHGIELVDGGDIPCRYSSLYKSLIGRGRGEIVTDLTEKTAALKDLMTQQTGKSFDFTEAMLKSVRVLKIVLDSYSVKGKLG